MSVRKHAAIARSKGAQGSRRDQARRSRPERDKSGNPLDADRRPVAARAAAAMCPDGRRWAAVPGCLTRGSGLALLATALLVAGCGAGKSVATLVQPGLVRERSGLLADYGFRSARPTTALLTNFELNGSASSTDAWVSLEADGLHVGVDRHQPETFKGFFAVTKAAYPATSVFHVRMSREVNNVMSSSNTGEAVFAVQTGDTKRTGDINYVLVASVTSGGLTHWEIGDAEGHVANATTTILWTSRPSRTAPISEDITLRTDGHSSYTVYFGNRIVYQSNRLTMNIVPPFQTYLEVQALEIAYQSGFQDFWITSNDAILVEGLHQGDLVTLTPEHGTPVGAVADASGEAELALSAPQAKGEGTLTIQDGGTLRRFPGLLYAGGDIYRVRA